MTAQEAIKILKEEHDWAQQPSYVNKALNMGIEALEKQIPKKCKKFRDICDCGHSVFPHMDYCDICGQALDWDG